MEKLDFFLGGQALDKIGEISDRMGGKCPRTAQKLYRVIPLGLDLLEKVSKYYSRYRDDIRVDNPHRMFATMLQLANIVLKCKGYGYQVFKLKPGEAPKTYLVEAVTSPEGLYKRTTSVQTTWPKTENVTPREWGIKPSFLDAATLNFFRVKFSGELLEQISGIAQTCGFGDRKEVIAESIHLLDNVIKAREQMHIQLRSMPVHMSVIKAGELLSFFMNAKSSGAEAVEVRRERGKGVVLSLLNKPDLNRGSGTTWIDGGFKNNS